VATGRERRSKHEVRRLQAAGGVIQEQEDADNEQGSVWSAVTSTKPRGRPRAERHD